MFIDHSFTKTDRTNHKCTKLVVQGPVHRMGFQKFEKSFPDRFACPHGNERNYYRYTAFNLDTGKIEWPAWVQLNRVCVFAIHSSTFSKLCHSGDCFQKIAFSMSICVDETEKGLRFKNILAVGSYFLKKNASSWLRTEGIYLKLFNL